MKKVGILTMHRVDNYGSALQAWATQEVLNRLGYNAQLIDYVFPNRYHKQFVPKSSLVLKTLRLIRNILYKWPSRQKHNAFMHFRRKYFSCTNIFETRESLRENIPVFDLYLVGSDQVWNPNVTHDDFSFYLDFLPSTSLKISYASSFSQSRLENNYAQKVAELLRGFTKISVREANAQQIVKDLIGNIVPVCLDPTLLLQKDDYASIAAESKVIIKGKFLLVYVLNYAFNPYPYATKFIEQLSKKFGLRVVCIDFTSRQHLQVKSCIHLHDAIGPSEFLWLFSHATCIVTTSFHGTAFALNFGIPFYSIVNNKPSGDDRMLNLLQECDASQRVVLKDAQVPDFNLSMNWEHIHKRLEILRYESIDYLKEALSR